MLTEIYNALSGKKYNNRKKNPKPFTDILQFPPLKLPKPNKTPKLPKPNQPNK